MNPNWIALEQFHKQFEANVSALAAREPGLASVLRQHQPARSYHIAAVNQRLLLGETDAEGIRNIPVALSPEQARNTCEQLFPNQQCSMPVLIAGLDQGWLWDSLYRVPPGLPTCPGFKPPLYFLAPDLERLWVVLHYQQWTNLLADPRVMIHAGPDCTAQLRDRLICNPGLGFPRAAVTVNPSIWKPGETFDTLIADLVRAAADRYESLKPQLAARYDNLSPADAGERLRKPGLRVLGITSRFTTFLQHSMRDWLAAFEAMGHQTKLLIEGGDHEQMTALVHAKACAEFAPDLILMIDHYRKPHSGIPLNVPCVMWVQDKLPHIYSSEAGAAQTRMDFAIGYGRQDCHRKFGYPISRFMPALVGVNHLRFTPGEPSAEDRRRFSCDISYVSHASATAEAIVEKEINQLNSTAATKLLREILARLKAIYDADRSLTEPAPLRDIITESMAAVSVSTENVDALLDLVIQRINNALFRHQSIRWVAETGVNLHLYGKGWDTHPEFSRFARGVADNQTQLASIYRCSAINLQVTPFGSAHQRSLDGMMAGGFFLLRETTGDVAERIYQKIWQWAEKRGIQTASEFYAWADADVNRLLDEAAMLTGVHARSVPEQYFTGIAEAADLGFTRCASTLWDDFDAVAFNERQTLQAKLRWYLDHAEDRHEIARRMRGRIIDTHTYESISRRMLAFLAGDLAGADQMKSHALAA